MITPPPVRPNQKWSMDFVTDTTVAGRRFRALAIIDDYSRECPAIEVDTSLGGARVGGILERLAETRGSLSRSQWTTDPSSRARPWTSGHIVRESS